MEFPPVQSVALPQLFSEISLGNVHAFALCRVLWSWLSLIKAHIGATRAGPSPEEIIRISLEAAATFAKNPFWQEHKQSLLPLLIQAGNAYADGIRLAKYETFRERTLATYLQSQYQEIFWHIAKIRGGYDHMAAMTQKYRCYPDGAIPDAPVESSALPDLV